MQTNNKSSKKPVTHNLPDVPDAEMDNLLLTTLLEVEAHLHLQKAQEQLQQTQWIGNRKRDW